MNRFVNFLRREQGLTLIELIAAVTLFSLVAILISSVMMFGIRSYQKVSIENKLRDEGDLLMSSVITKMYTFGPNAVTASETINPDSKVRETSIILNRNNDRGGIDKVQISIANGVLSFHDIPEPTSSSAIEVTNVDVTSRLGPESAIELECSLTKPCESGLIHVKLQLISNEDGKEMKLESNFGF